MAATASVQDRSDIDKRPPERVFWSSEPLVNESGKVYCDRPKVLVYASGRTSRVACQRKCDTCLIRYRRQIADTARLGLEMSSHPFKYMITLTAPGKGTDIAAWNTDSGWCWNRMITALRRFDQTIQYLRAAEVQDGSRRADGVGRMALHHHVLVGSSLPLTKNRVRKLAVKAGYGYMVDVAPITTAKAAASYVAKYVAKATGQRHLVPWLGDVLDDSTGVLQLGVVRARYRTWSRSRSYGIPLRLVKEARYRAYCAARDNAILNEIQSQRWDFVSPTPLSEPTSEASPP